MEEQLNRIFGCERPDPEEAIKPLEKLLEIEPSLGGAWSKLAWAYFETGRREDAEKAVATALRLNPDDRQAQIVFLPLCLGIDFKTDPFIVDHHKMIKALEQIINETASNFPAAWGYLGFSYIMTRKYKEAERAFSTAIALEPNNPVWHLQLSSIYSTAAANSLATPEAFADSKETLKRTLGPEGIEDYRDVDPYFYRWLKTSEYVEVPHAMKEITLEALGCSYEYASQLVEKHAWKIIRLSTDEKVTEVAKRQLATLKMMDQERGYTLDSE